MRIGILKRPAARPHIGPLRDTVAAHVQDLFRYEPIETAPGLFDSRFAAGFESTDTIPMVVESIRVAL